MNVDIGEEKRRENLDKEVLKELERLIGKSIPHINSIQWNTFGVEFEVYYEGEGIVFLSRRGDNYWIRII